MTVERKVDFFYHVFEIEGVFILKKYMTFIILLSALVIISGCSKDSAGSEEDYPAKDIEILVGAGPGGGTDNFARATESQLSEKLGVNINVTNQAEASGAVANKNTASKPADGYTLNYVSSTFIIGNASGENKTGLDELTPVARMQSDILSLIVNPDRFDSFDEFVEYAESNDVKVGGTHSNSPDEMGFLELKEASGVDMRYISYDGTGEVQAAVMGDNLDAYVGVISAVEEYVKSGDLQPVLIFSDERLGDFPDVPVTVEDYDWDITNGNERGILVHADTPTEIIDKLEETLKEIYESDAYNEYEENSSLHHREGWMGSAEYLDKLKEDYDMYQELMNK